MTTMTIVIMIMKVTATKNSDDNMSQLHKQKKKDDDKIEDGKEEVVEDTVLNLKDNNESHNDVIVPSVVLKCVEISSYKRSTVFWKGKQMSTQSV